MHVHLKYADFKYGATTLESLPPVDYPEIAVIGRSNVGKSSFINRLTNRKKLARVSNTPGRTQQANLFALCYTIDKGADRILGLVDLPGFGYAQVAKSKRDLFSTLIVDYLSNRSSLKTVVLLTDCRRDPGEEELFLQRHLFEQGISTLIVITKCDKLKRQELTKRKAVLAKAYHLAPEDLIESHKEGSLEPFWERLVPLLELD